MTASGAKNQVLRLTPARLDDLGRALKGSWGSTCWCMFPRWTDAEYRARSAGANPGWQRRAAMAERLEQGVPPGLLAYRGDRPVGWVAVAPREEFARVDRSRATPRVDRARVWVVACLAVHPSSRGEGVAVELIRAAVQHAGEHGAEVVEAYPRAGAERTGAGNAWFGTEPMFRRAGFEVVRGPLPSLPRTWLPRVTMRATAGS